MQFGVKKIKFLGLIMLNSVNVKDWLDSNFHPLINSTNNQLKNGEN